MVTHRATARGPGGHAVRWHNVEPPCSALRLEWVYDVESSTMLRPAPGDEVLE